MIKVAICDDDFQELERAREYLKQYNLERPQYDISVTLFEAPLELLAHVEKHGVFDIFLLDVYMTGMLGTDAARQIRQLGESGEIIFLTTSRDHAIDAFEVNAAQYLVKPYTERALFAALDKVLYRANVERRHIITFKTSAGIARIYTRNVVFTETSRNNYQVIHTIDNEKHEVRMTSTELFDLLSPTKSFVRCGASINLNLRFVRQIKKDTIVFDSGEYISYPYRVYQSLKEAFLSFQMSIDD